MNGCLELEGWRNREVAAKGYRVFPFVVLKIF